MRDISKINVSRVAYSLHGSPGPDLTCLDVPGFRDPSRAFVSALSSLGLPKSTFPLLATDGLWDDIARDQHDPPLRSHSVEFY